METKTQELDEANKILRDLSDMGHVTSKYMREEISKAQSIIRRIIHSSNKEFVDSVDKEEANLLNCFNCGDKMREGDSHIWYHGDQDDLVCDDCASELEHTDTAYAGLPVRREE